MEECTRVLIPTYKPGGLKARIYPHWKDAPIFTEVCFKESNAIETKTFILDSDALIINTVKKEGIKDVIALSLSTRAVELLSRIGVTILIGKIKTVPDAIEKYRKGELYIIKVTKIPQKGNLAKIQ